MPDPATMIPHSAGAGSVAMEDATTAAPAGRRRSDRLLEALAPFESVLILTHDNPDPDAVASGWAMWTLITKKLQKPVRFIAGGMIVRAENRRLIDLLKPPLELVNDEAPPAADPAVAKVFVDYTPFGEWKPTPAEARTVAIIDHHATAAKTKRRLLFRDVRPNVAATASLAAQYLEQQGTPPDSRLATALLYAIRTETSGADTEHTRLDRHAINCLTPLADPSALAEIANAPLPTAYFGDLALALQNTFLYDDASITILPRASGPETAAEVADLLIRSETVRRVLCAAKVGENVLVSVRTVDQDAAALVQSALKGLGRGGGHARRAGGRIHVGGGSDAPMPEALQDQLRTQWLAACKVERPRGVRLVPRREIVSNL